MKNGLHKAVFAVSGLIAVGSIMAGVVDRREQKKTEKCARSEGRKIHKPYGPYEKYVKRALDFYLSSLALIVLSPVMAVTAIIVRLKLGSPIIFTQERPGKDEKIFTLHKFRTMTDERDKDGELLPDKDRLTAFGSFLRSTSIDELPELFNIIKGDMSIIGPRPLLVRYLPVYTKTEKHRHDVRPGLSGLAQVNGRNLVKWDQRLAYDVKYVNRVTFLGDVKIVFQTIAKMFNHEDVAVNTDEVETYLDIERGYSSNV